MKAKLQITDFFKKNYDDLIRAILFFVFLAIICCHSSCATKKPDQVTSERSLVSTDTHSLVQSTVVNQPIQDYLFIGMPVVQTLKPACDSTCQKYLYDYLRQIRMKKISGANEFGVYFDEKKNELVLYAKIGKTEEKTIEQKDTHAEVKAEKTVTVKTVTVRYIPWYVQVFAWIGVIYVAVLLYKIYRKFNPIKLPL